MNNLSFLIATVSLIVICNSCEPVINSFSVSPRTIIADDSLKINYKIKGNPTLIVHERLIPEDSENAGASGLPLKYLEFTLVVQKGKKETRRFVQVVVLPKETTNEIVFPTYLHGDTLIAAGEKNAERWGDKFSILTVTSGSGRQLLVKHANRSSRLDKNGVICTDFKGTLVEGRWEIRSILTEGEKKDMSSAPSTLRIIATLEYKRR